MNERIQELAEEAGLEYNFDPMLWLKHEKFAKLIVQECIELCDELQKWPSTEPRHCASDIRIHFGVE